MSGRSDLRMYVEHLFEGRTLDAETIELKEEIYGNLVARFDDYVSQGMGEDEAFQRTCDAVSSVDDVIDGKDETAAPTTAMPKATPGPAPATSTDAPPAPEPARSAPGRWSTAVIVAVVAVVLVVAGIAGCTVFNMLDTQRAVSDYQSQTSQDVQQIDQGDDDASQTTTDVGTTNGTAPQDGTGNRYGAPAQGDTDLMAEVQSHSVDDLASYEGMPVSSEPFLAMMNSLPLGLYAHEAMAEPDTGTIELTYAYDDRDALARDDDCVDRALVYDVVAAMSVTSDLQTLRIVEEEVDDDGELDRDVHVFDRATVEGILGFPLNAGLLVSETWDATRNEVMTTRAWDAIWESADVD